MHTFIRRLAVVGLVAVLLLPAQVSAQGPGSQPGGAPPSAGAGGVLPEASPQAASWYNGAIQYSQITNCASIIQGFPYQENGAGAYVGYLADLNAGKPAPNDVYYVHVVIGGLGNSCSGMRAFIDLALPANTATAVDGTHAAYCLYDGSPLSMSECPQSYPASPYNSGAVQVLSTDAAHGNTWPIPQGHILEIQIPVRSTTSLANSPMRANVWMLDGNSSPWLRPQQGVYVFSGLSSPPTISYPSPSTISVTTTSAHSEAYLYTYGAGGTGYFDLGTTPSYGFIHEAVPIPAGSTAWVAWDEWGPPALTPDTLYHWRFTFTPSGGSTVYGADQTFRTLPDGLVTVGNGLAASCTPSALNSAFAGAKLINFDCGSLPITITMSAGRSIAGNLTINGGNKVTLDAGWSSNHFDVQSGAHLTLTQLSLVNGYNSATCGGAVRVTSGGSLVLQDTRLVSNSSLAQGGAVCVAGGGSADIRSTLFMSNTGGTHGGAIGQYGTAAVNDSRFSGNSAGTNGGAIDNTGVLTVINGAFSDNITGYRGGGINNYVGTMTISGASFNQNSAGMYGGGISNDAGTATVQASSFSGNSGGSGGGLESSGTLSLINSTVSGNHATGGNGGGLVWVTPGAIALLNDTIVGNTASAQGGNIYVGGSFNDMITPWNTLVASGSPNNCDSTVWSRGYNLESANTCGFTGTGDRRNANPQLGPLQNNGGSTLTHALRFGSPALDAGNGGTCPGTDQRGVARPLDGNHDGSAVCDIGAYEAPPQWGIFLPLVLRH